MMATKDADQTMEQVLLLQIAAAEKMTQTLIDENHALIKRDASAIENHTQTKSELSDVLATLTLQQQKLLTKAGLSLSRAGIDKFIDSAPHGQKNRLRDAFHRLHQLLDQCQRQNLINGNIISANRQAAEMALAILRGHHLPSPTLYNANGKTPSADQGNTLAKA
jgi:flagellar biosynthesis/type III secretory pathway chaperone